MRLVVLPLQGVLGGTQTAPTSLSRVTPSTAGRAAATFGVTPAVTVFLSRTERLHGIETGRLPKTWWHLTVTIGTMVGAAAGGLVIVSVWGLSDQLIGVFAANLGPEALVRLGISALLLIGAYTMTGLSRQLVEEIARARGSLGEHGQEIAFRVGQVTLYLVSLLLILTLWQVNIGGILVGAGVLGIVVEVAARQTLGAMLAGFVLMFSRAFEVGDWIEGVEDEGIVTDIAIVTTRIRTVDAERAAEVVQDAVETLDEPMTVPTPQVVLERFDNSAVILGVRYWIDNPSARRRWRSKTAVIGEVKRAFEDAGIKIPFPQRELMGREEANRFVLAGGDENAGEARKP